MNRRRDLAHDLLLPTVLFGALGGMTWAVRGSSGYGASAGCIFAGVALGAAWWFIAREPAAAQSRRYASGWIILAMSVAFGIAGNRGWMQWPSFYDNRLTLDYSKGDYVFIERGYGFLWMFLAGVPWAGLGACGLAWCATDRRMGLWQWALRLACGVGMAYLLSEFLYDQFPSVFLPLYDTLEAQYHDLKSHHELWKLVRDNREAMLQLGLYLGFLMFEIARRDWKNVVLISTVGLLNGAGWSLLQTWSWASKVWPGAQFNFWRCWESTGGVSIGVAFGIAYYLVNRRAVDEDSPTPEAVAAHPPGFGWLIGFLASTAILYDLAPEIMPDWCAQSLTAVAVVFAIGYVVRAHFVARGAPQELIVAWSPYGGNLERWGAYAGLIFGLGISIQRGLKGWANVYLGDERYWNQTFMNVIGPLMIVGLAAVSLRTLLRRHPGGKQGDPFPDAYAIVWCVLAVQNVLAQMITGPPSNWNEVVFNIYYLLLFLITAVVVFHYHEDQLRKRCSNFAEHQPEGDDIERQPRGDQPIVRRQKQQHAAILPCQFRSRRPGPRSLFPRDFARIQPVARGFAICACYSGESCRENLQTTGRARAA